MSIYRKENNIMLPLVKCRKCGLYKNKLEYFENKANIDGVCGMCIECMKIYNKDLILKRELKSLEEYKKANPEKYKYRCRNCEEYKDISEFYKDKDNKYGISTLCKICSKEYNKTHPNKLKYNPEYSKNYHLQYKFGIGIDEHDRIYAEQNGCCNICKKPFETMDMDHDHETGKIRGLLCRGCNIALGLFHDSINSLEKALLYLE